MPRIKPGRKPRFGTIDRLPSNRYRARYRVNGALSTLGTFETWEDADRALTEHEAKITLGQVATPKRKGQTGLQTLVDAYYRTEARRLSPKTNTENLRLLSTRVLPYFAGLPLNQIDPVKVDVWFHQHELAKVPTIRRNAYFALSAVMNYGVKRGYLAESPCQVKGAGAVVAAERPYMSPAAFDAILGPLQPGARMVFEFMLGSHARLGEVVALTVGDIDLTLGTVRIERQIRADGQPPAPTKTGNHRTVKVFSSSLEPVRRMLALRPDAAPGDALFLRADGRPVTRGTLVSQWRRAREAAGLPQFHIHDIRHTGLVLAESTGQGIKNVQHRAGHSTTAAALRYQHMRTEVDAGMADAADAALRLARGELVEKNSADVLIR